jgi:hypothetical protein
MMRSSLALIVNNSILFPSFARPPRVLHQLPVLAYYRALLHTDKKKNQIFFPRDSTHHFKHGLDLIENVKLIVQA